MTGMLRVAQRQLSDHLLGIQSIQAIPCKLMVYEELAGFGFGRHSWRHRNRKGEQLPDIVGSQFSTTRCLCET